MNESRLQRKFRDDIDFRIDVENVGGNRCVIFVPLELTGGVESRVVLNRSADHRWWLTDESHTFRHESKIGTTIFSGVKLSLEVREEVSSSDLLYFLVAITRLGSAKIKKCDCVNH